MKHIATVVMMLQLCNAVLVKILGAATYSCGRYRGMLDLVDNNFMMLEPAYIHSALNLKIICRLNTYLGYTQATLRVHPRES